ncbi:DUF983 domain-containing protein [Alsobacter sp. KACC 23698]|uniref:DUF983 domain-containing protein n=1 Tax=Alsobacter sp. KACC 23698 TaxID=3149229 RepID=A0AAU7JHJ9_9HYPH
MTIEPAREIDAAPPPAAAVPDRTAALLAGLRGRCPRCGQGPLIRGFIAVAPECGACGLPFDFADSGDGPAVFIMLIAGFLVVGGVLVVDMRYAPAWWVHALLWPPVVIGLCLGLLRPLKGLLIAAQFANKAEQGRLER